MEWNCLLEQFKCIGQRLMAICSSLSFAANFAVQAPFQTNCAQPVKVLQHLPSFLGKFLLVSLVLLTLKSAQWPPPKIMQHRSAKPITNSYNHFVFKSKTIKNQRLQKYSRCFTDSLLNGSVRQDSLHNMMEFFLPVTRLRYNAQQSFRDYFLVASTLQVFFRYACL